MTEAIALALVAGAIPLARQRGALWLHADHEPDQDGFRRRRAGLIDLADQTA